MSTISASRAISFSGKEFPLNEADLKEVKLTSKGTTEKVGIVFKKARSNVSEIDSSLLGWVLEVGSAITKGKPVAMVTKKNASSQSASNLHP